MRGLAMLLATALAVLVVPATTAAAAEPDLVDECGVTDRNDRTALPWQDICAAWFDSEVSDDDEVVTVTVTIELDGDVDPRTPSSYQTIFYDGDCQYWLMHDDDGDGVTASSDTAQVRCGSSQRVPCDPEILEDLGFFCFELAPATFYDFEFAAEGRTVTLTFSTDGDAADLPLSEGDVIDHFSVATSQNVAGHGTWDSNCGVRDGHGTDCTSTFGDHAWTRALGHTIHLGRTETG